MVIDVCIWLVCNVSKNIEGHETKKNTGRCCVFLNNNDRLIKWHNDYQERKAQKAKIKEELLPIAWHQSRWWDWCVPEDEKKETEKLFLTTWYAEIKNVLIKRRCWNLVQKKEVTSRDFYGQRQITDLFTININKMVVSDNVPCNNGKDCSYIVGYQVDRGLVPLFIKTPKNIFNYGVP